MRWIDDVREELARLDASARSLRKFALTVGGVLLLVAAFALLRRPGAGPARALGLAGAALGLAGFVRPLALRPLHRAWMALAFALGWLTSRAVLTVLFCVVLTPLSLLARLTGKRFLETGRDPTAPTYWKKRARPRPRYEKMF